MDLTIAGPHLLCAGPLSCCRDSRRGLARGSLRLAGRACAGQRPVRELAKEVLAGGARASPRVALAAGKRTGAEPIGSMGNDTASPAQLRLPRLGGPALSVGSMLMITRVEVLEGGQVGKWPRALTEGRNR